LLETTGLVHLSGHRSDLNLDEITIFDPDMGMLSRGTVVFLAVENPSSTELAARVAADRGAAGIVIGPRTTASQRQAIGELGLVVFQRSTGLNWVETIDAVRRAAIAADNSPTTNLGVADGDLLGLADALADVLGGPIVLEDSRFNVLAYSTYSGSFDHGRDLTILGRRTPKEWVDHLSDDGTLSVLVSSDEVVEVRDGPRAARRRLVSGLRSGGEFLGLLWVAEGEKPLPPDAAHLMKEAAILAAAHIIHHQLHMRERESSRASLVKGLLEGTTVPQSTVEQLGLQVGSRYAVIGLRETDDGHIAGKHARLVEAVNTYCQAYRWSAASCGVGGAVYVIVSMPKSGTNDPHMRLVDGLGQGLLETCERALDRKVLVAISELSSRLTSAPTLRKQVDRCLELSFDGVSLTGVVTFQGLRSRIALGRAAQAVREDPMLLFPELEILKTIDRDDGTNYVDTLGAFLMSLGNMRTAAEKLGVHITTLRYRMLYGLLLRDGGEESAEV
jgi:hypothetical protein